MSDAIEFEVTQITDEVSLFKRLGTEQYVCCNGTKTLSVSYNTTPAEFDAVARGLNYVPKSEAFDAWSKSAGYPGCPAGDITSLLSQEARDGEELDDTLRRIIAEKDDTQKLVDAYQVVGTEAEINLEESTSHTCTLDGVTYRGNEETIFALKHQHEMVEARSNLLTKDREIIDDLKRQLAEMNKTNEVIRNNLTEARASNPIPDKWRRAIELALSKSGDADELLGAAEMIIGAERLRRYPHQNEKDCVAAAVKICLNWLAAELEKGEK